MLPEMTEREKRILFFIRLWQYKKRYSPSVRDIAAKFGVKHQSITYALKGLKEKGYIEVAEEKNWRHRSVLFPKGFQFPWGNDALPDELFGHFKEAPVEKQEQKKEENTIAQTTIQDEDNGNVRLELL